MLQELFIQNIALIRKLTIPFDNGLNVLSGETGAGKTIIVDCIGLILGERGSKELIRYGEEKGFAEALFSPEDADVIKDILDENGIDSDGLIITRELTSAGKNICRINGRLVSMAVLRQAMSRLINLHGQGQHSEIFEKKHQLEMLDRYAACKAEADAVSAAYTRYSDVKKQLEGLTTDEKEQKRLSDMLAYQINEIQSAKLKNGEEEELTAKRELMRNSERISEGINEAHELISGESGVMYKLKGAMHALDGISRYSERYEKLFSSVSDAYYSLEDTVYELSDCSDEICFNESELDEIEYRLDAINTLKRKYGSDVDEILKYAEDAEKRLGEIEHYDELKASLEKKLEEYKNTLYLACVALSDARKASAKKLETELVSQLSELGMKSASFTVGFDAKLPDKSGIDDVEFYITLNKGEPEKPLAKVASGGEASRIMLAIKNIFASRESVSTLIFDEIDTGISGNMARTVARKLENIACERQVICVSHLPQLAAMGDANFEIVKTENESETVTTVTRLDKAGKLSEIARLSGGIQSGVATAHAEEMLEECESYKLSLKKG